MNIIRRRIAIPLLAFAVVTPALAQNVPQDIQDCTRLKKEAVQLSSREALSMALQKPTPPASPVSPEAQITWTVLVNQDGIVQCYLDNTPAESNGRLNLLLSSGKALQSWKFKPYAQGGRKRPFITKLTFTNQGKIVTVE